MFALQCEHVGSVLCGWNHKHIDYCYIKAADKPDSESYDEPATKQNKLMMKKKDDHAPSKTRSDEDNDIKRDPATARYFRVHERRLSEDH